MEHDDVFISAGIYRMIYIFLYKNKHDITSPIAYLWKLFFFIVFLNRLFNSEIFVTRKISLKTLYLFNKIT